MNCKNCGKEISSTTEYCEQCNFILQRIENDKSETTNFDKHVNNDINIDNKNLNKKKSKIMVSAISVVLILISISIFFIVRKPIIVFGLFTNNIYNEILDNIAKIETLSGNFSIKTNITTKEESDVMFKILSNISINSKYELDHENQTASIKLNSSYGSKELLNSNIYIKNSSLYIYLDNLYDKYIKINNDDSIQEISTNKNFIAIIKEVRTALLKSTKSSYFSKTKEKIIINDKSINSTKNSMLLNNDNIKTFSKEFLTYLKNSDSFIENSSDLLTLTKTEIIDIFDNYIKQIEDIDVENNYILMSLYTKGFMNEVVQMNLEIKNENKITNLIINGIDKENYVIKYINNDNFIEGNVEFLKKEDKYSTNSNFTGNINGNKINILYNDTYELNKPITQVDISNNIAIDDLTMIDYTKIGLNIMQAEGILTLLEDAEISIFDILTN